METIIEDGCIYVDKTEIVHTLVNGGKYYFLSRPRRFGKSLFVDTLKQAFLGNKHLFKDLYLENNWDWDVKHPVIHFDFSDSSATANSNKWLIELIENTLLRHAKHYQVELDLANYGLNFSQLIMALYKKYNNRVVILIDEYDKPILDVIP